MIFVAVFLFGCFCGIIGTLIVEWMLGEAYNMGKQEGKSEAKQ